MGSAMSCVWGRREEDQGDQRLIADNSKRSLTKEQEGAAEEMARAEAERARAEEDARKADDERRRLEAERRVLEEAVQGAEAERQKAVEEHKLRIRKKEEAEREREAAQKAATETRAEQEEAERMLREGAHPVVVPTNEQFREAKGRLQYQEGYAHIAVTGVAGSGKSSLINALRGLNNGAPGAAPTGIMETTKAITRYPDPDPGKRVVWYDVPGAGTLAVPDWVYFTDQGLYVLDCVLVLIDARFTATDVAILRNCARFRIPAYIVRSKARQNVYNLAQDMSDEDSDEEAEGDASTTAAALERAAERYVAESRKSVAHNLQLAELPQQRVYLVDKETLVQLVKGRRPKTTLDENDLLRDMTAVTTTSSEGRADG